MQRPACWDADERRRRQRRVRVDRIENERLRHARECVHCRRYSHWRVVDRREMYTCGAILTDRCVPSSTKYSNVSAGVVPSACEYASAAGSRPDPAVREPQRKVGRADSTAAVWADVTARILCCCCCGGLAAPLEETKRAPPGLLAHARRSLALLAERRRPRPARQMECAIPLGQ